MEQLIFKEEKCGSLSDILNAVLIPKQSSFKS